MGGTAAGGGPLSCPTAGHSLAPLRRGGAGLAASGTPGSPAFRPRQEASEGGPSASPRPGGPRADKGCWDGGTHTPGTCPPSGHPQPHSHGSQDAHSPSQCWGRSGSIPPISGTPQGCLPPPPRPQFPLVAGSPPGRPPRVPLALFARWAWVNRARPGRLLHKHSRRRGPGGWRRCPRHVPPPLAASPSPPRPSRGDSARQDQGGDWDKSLPAWGDRMTARKEPAAPGPPRRCSRWAPCASFFTPTSPNPRPAPLGDPGWGTQEPQGLGGGPRPPMGSPP